jgi:hypothetical protein
VRAPCEQSSAQTSCLFVGATNPTLKTTAKSDIIQRYKIAHQNTKAYIITKISHKDPPEFVQNNFLKVI